MAKKANTRRGPKWKQPRAIDALDAIASTHGYKTSRMKKDPAHRDTGKKFLPDLIAMPKTGSEHRVFEVEKTVNNNTVFKSLASLSHYLMQHDGSSGYLVVPASDMAFAKKCLDTQVEIIRWFQKTCKGANPKIEIEVVSFEDVEADEVKVNRWEAGGRIGQPPKCKYLPR